MNTGAHGIGEASKHVMHSLQPFGITWLLTSVLASSASAASNRSALPPCSSCVGMNLQSCQ